MNKKTLEERIREKARAEFGQRVTAIFAQVMEICPHPTPVQAVITREAKTNRDITDKILIEILKAHIIKTKTPQHEEDALDAFVADAD